MAVTNPIDSAATFARGLRSEFKTTYRKRYQHQLDRIGRNMALALPSDKFSEIYGYYESAPHARRIPFGEEIPSKPFTSRNFEVDNVDWGMSVEWFKNSRLFDQLNEIVTQARDAGKNFAGLPERVFYQITTASTDTDLLQAIPNAPDGAALYAATAAGVDRFGVSGGNIETGTGVASSDAVRTDFFNSIERIMRFQDTEGQPLHTEDIIDGGITLYYNVQNDKVFRDAFIQSRTLEGGAAVTNIVLESGLKVQLVPSQRITDNDWFLHFDDIEVKPIFEQIAMPLEDFVEDENNSDRARRTRMEGIFWSFVAGYGVALPIATVKINN